MSALTKICEKHGVERIHKSLRRGWVCPICARISVAEYRHKNKDKVNAWNKKQRAKYADKENELHAKYRAKNPDKEKARHGKYRAENPDKVRACQEKYRTGNKEKLKVIHSKWRNNNREKCKSYFQNYRARKHGNGGRYTSQEWRDLCDRYGNRCLACGATGKLSVDHVIPISKGGSNSIDNLQPLCKSCNSSKGVKIIDYR